MGCNSKTEDKISNKNNSTIRDTSKQNNWNQQNRLGAVENCILPGNPRDYCECSVSILETIFTHTEFIEFDKLLRSGSRPSDKIVAKMIEMQQRVKDKCGLPTPIK